MRRAAHLLRRHRPPRPRHCSSDAFYGAWTLPFRQEPWALPFRVTQQEALDAFIQRHDGGTKPRLTLRAVQARHVPFYVFEGDLSVRFTGVVGYEDGGAVDAAGLTPAVEYTRRDIACPPIALGADQGAVSAVYAGFGFRRYFVRRALSGGLSAELLATAVPLTQLDALAGDQPMGCMCDDFEMKPSFAFKTRLLERLPEVAHHLAEAHMEHADAQTLQYWDDGGGSSACPADAAPDYERVDDVDHELSTPRLHDKGVVVLPVWAVEYLCLGKRFRAFVSGLAPEEGELPTVSGMPHRNPWSTSGGTYAAARPSPPRSAAATPPLPHRTAAHSPCTARPEIPPPAPVRNATFWNYRRMRRLRRADRDIRWHQSEEAACDAQHHPPPVLLAPADRVASPLSATPHTHTRHTHTCL